MPALPQSVTAEGRLCLSEDKATSGAIIPFPAPPDEKSNRILAKARSLQELLGLEQAA
jgi:hypothetical protein